MALKTPELEWFWSIIPDVANSPTEDVSANYMDALDQLSDVELAKFATHCSHIINVTQNNDNFHNLCYLICTGGDDSRYDLATWLIIKGKTFWTTAMTNTDALADFKNFDFLTSTYGFEELEAFEEMEFERDIDLFDMEEEHNLIYNYPPVLDNPYQGIGQTSKLELKQKFPKLSKLLGK